VLLKNNTDIYEPFLKWPGGKRWLIPELKHYISKSHTGHYYEPFLGGGAVFFSFNFQNSSLSDSNKDLIDTYVSVRDSPSELISILKGMNQNKESYYLERSSLYKDPVRRAAQFLYLNRLAFGGMYRVNLNGRFNVPYGGGRKADILWTKDLIKNASVKLQGTSILHLDFEHIFKSAKSGDLIYCDPPYTVAHNFNGFQRYNENIFSWDDQVRLFNACIKAQKRGVKIIVSNAAHESIKELYSTTEPLIVNRFSSLSKKTSSRKRIDEFLFLFNC